MKESNSRVRECVQIQSAYQLLRGRHGRGMYFGGVISLYTFLRGLIQMSNRFITIRCLSWYVGAEKMTYLIEIEMQKDL